MQITKTLLSLVLALALAIGAVAAWTELSPASPETPAPEPTFQGTLSDFYSSESGEYDLLTLEDIYIPEGIAERDLGLFIYDYSGNKWVSTTAETIPFDETRPTIIFTHGMGIGARLSNPRDWYEAGFNACSFVWHAFSPSDPAECQRHIWSNVNMNWESDGVTEATDLPDASVTEIFAAYYNDLFSRCENYTGKEIRVYGHSMGGQIASSFLSYALTALEAGRFDPSFLPDHILMLDPFFSNSTANYDCRWLGEPLGEGGSAKRAYEAVIKGYELGIAVEEFRTSPYVRAATLGADPNYYEMLAEIIVYHNAMDGTAFFPQIKGLVDGIARCHTYSETWYNSTIHNEYFDTNSTSLHAGLNGLVYAPEVYSVMGYGYTYDFNETEFVYSDDAITSVGIEQNRIAGFAYRDENGDGIMNERVASRMSGVKVELCTMPEADGSYKVLQTAETNLSGYYCFRVDNLTNYRLRFTAYGDYTITDNAVWKDNCINASTEHNLQTLIVNGGFRSARLNN